MSLQAPRDAAGEAERLEAQNQLIVQRALSKWGSENGYYGYGVAGHGSAVPPATDVWQQRLQIGGARFSAGLAGVARLSIDVGGGFAEFGASTEASRDSEAHCAFFYLFSGGLDAGLEAAA